MSDDNYQMIKPPPASARSKTKTSDRYVSSYLGKSEKGVYSALIDLDGPNFEFGCLVSFLLVRQSGCSSVTSALKQWWILPFIMKNMAPTDHGSLTIRRVPTGRRKHSPLHKRRSSLLNGTFDNGAIIPQTKAKDNWLHLIYFLGFHPYKEIAFLCISQTSVISYHLNSSKVQYLGTIDIPEMENGFLYTPCWMGELSEKNKA